MDLKEFGKLLKEERLRKGLKISEVMEKTKISRMNLQAIEDGNEKALPHPVYAKGFVKNYAKFLGMDADKMGNTLAQIYVSREESDYDDMVLADASKLPAVRRALPRVIYYLAILLMLVLLGAVGWIFRDDLQQFFVSQTQETASPPPARLTGQETPGNESFPELNRPEEAFESGRLSSPFPALTEETGREALEDDTLPELQSQTAERAGDTEPDFAPGELPEATPGAGSEEPAQAEPLPAPPAEQTPAGQTPVEQTPAEQDPVEQQPTQAGPDNAAMLAEQQAAAQEEGAEQTLEVRATENCWLSAQADNNRPREAFLRPGERFVVAFEESLELRLGNAGGVVLYLDGRPWPFSARSGEVMVLRFP